MSAGGGVGGLSNVSRRWGGRVKQCQQEVGWEG